MTTTAVAKKVPETMEEPIRFYSTKGQYGCFSNFSRHPIVADGRLWPTTEHFYQAHKYITSDPKWFAKIAFAETPRQAMEMGRDSSHPLRPDWEEVKDDVMRRACMHKFFLNNHCRETLLNSGSAEIIEASPIDWYWGEGEDGKGKNMLGKILMEIRTHLRYSRVPGTMVNPPPNSLKNSLPLRDGHRIVIRGKDKAYLWDGHRYLGRLTLRGNGFEIYYSDNLKPWERSISSVAQALRLLGYKDPLGEEYGF